jgi:putative chitinase
MQFNKDLFLSLYKDNFGRLNQSQVDGLLFLLGQIENDDWSRIEEVAYFLATIYWECSQQFQPIKEKRGKTLTAAQAKYWPSGFYGRGYVQITWSKNYSTFQTLLGLPLLVRPDLALQPEVAYKIASIGMKRGLFTGKRLSDYIGDKVNYRGARRIINGTDKADIISSIATRLESILRKAQVVGAIATPSPLDKVPTPVTLVSDSLTSDDLREVLITKTEIAKKMVKRIGLQVAGWLAGLWQVGAHGKFLVIAIVTAVIIATVYELYKHRNGAKLLITKLVKHEVK